METVLEDAAIEQVRATAVRCSPCDQRCRPNAPSSFRRCKGAESGGLCYLVETGAVRGRCRR